VGRQGGDRAKLRRRLLSQQLQNGFLQIVLPPERCAELRMARERRPGAQLITGPVGHQ
jgi:hypothetical protein